MRSAIALCVMLVCIVTTSPGEPAVTDHQFVLMPVKNDPTIAFRIEFRVGSQDDPPDKEGLAAITAAMLSDAATTKNSYEAILDRLFPLAASYSASVAAEQTVLLGRVHKDNLADYYPLFMDAILHPAFKQEDLDRIKSQTLNFLQNTLRYSSDEELGKAVLYTTIFAGSGYGHITEGSVGSVQSITLEDVRGFYYAHFTRAHVLVGVGGGYDPSLITALKQDLSTLPESTPATVPRPSPSLQQGMHVVLIEKNAPATAISMGFPLDVLRGERDWYPLAVATSWLGEHRNSSSHLYQVIREVRGLNYGDYAYIELYPNGGRRSTPPQNVARRTQLFEMWIRPVPNETRFFALRAALREFKHLVDQGMSKTEFELTRSFLSKYLLYYAPTTMERLGYALDDRFYRISGSHIQLFRDALKTMTMEDVNAAIRKHWQYGTMQIAVVTPDASSLAKAMSAGESSPITYRTPKPDSVLQEDKEIASFPVPVKGIRTIKVEDLFK